MQGNTRRIATNRWEERKNARVFTKKGDPSVDGIRCIEDGVMYHALSEGGTAGTHKGFDIWFKTEADELVLSSVGRLNVLQTNSIPSFQSLFACVCMFCNLAGALGCDWSYECRNLQQKGFKYCSECERSEAHGANAESPVKSVIGVLLAPNCNSPIVDARVAQGVAGDAARDILGGLQQLLTWLGDDVD